VRIPEVDLCVRPRDLQAVRPQDFDIIGCGESVPPPNTRSIDLYKVYPYSNVLAAAGAAGGGDILLDEKKQVDCNSDFFLHKITALDANGLPATGYLVRFQWYNGRYSSNALQLVDTFNGVCYTQDQQRETCPIRYPGGQFIGISLQNLNPFASINVMLFFEGVSRFYLCKRGGR
jgi:hypothetical protein